MFKRILFFLMVLVVGTAARAEGTIKEGQFMSSQILKKNVEFTVYLPPGYGRDERKYPVIYLMHGGGVERTRTGIAMVAPTGSSTA
ncbi:esterase family protein [Aliirhizobium terrae]|uniref:alpha/beta hydrolase-fold protein n=1 Tax=Terrirhizobium terrae TaxID=2926709 RepID=UPI00257675BA|nr:alpha/beta hydrolase-fold protein [Rhizobium sp. CC-CFT758]WJH39816.1 esterase family protein [Rhizobium sp. CC-CFT758]